MGQMKSPGMGKCVALVLALVATVVVVTHATYPIPAADIPNQCNSIERCCMPSPYEGKPAYNFQYEKINGIKLRRPAHLLTKKEIARLEKGYKLMRALPDSDPRSLLNQMKLHCLYCDNALYYAGQKYPLEVHGGWFFLPWHRMFTYWHERILTKLLDDDTFALPYWAWDNQQDVTPAANVMPAAYAKPSSPLYDVARNNCSFPPFVIDLDTISGCTNKTSDFLRIQNNRLQYTQLVVGSPTKSLFYGMPYYFGDPGGRGPGTFEDQPHGTVHAWLGKLDAPTLGPQYHPADDMGNFGRAAFDPIFYVVHTNVDRIWQLWSGLHGGKDSYPTHPAFLNTQFTFYDENADLVKMNVSQSLDPNLLGYGFEKLPFTWLTNGVQAGRENTIPLCNPLSKSAINTLIKNTPKQSSEVALVDAPYTFRADRPTGQKNGVEVLEISGLHIPNITMQAHWKAYLFYPNVSFLTGAACPEFVGTFNWIPHVGQTTINPDRMWRAAISPKLRQLGKEYVKSVVVTIIQTSFPLQRLTFDSAKIVYDNYPE